MEFCQVLPLKGRVDLKGIVDLKDKVDQWQWRSIPHSSKLQNSSDAGALENAEYPFIAIAPRSTQARSGSTW